MLKLKLIRVCKRDPSCQSVMTCRDSSSQYTIQMNYDIWSITPLYCMFIILLSFQQIEAWIKWSTFAGDIFIHILYMQCILSARVYPQGNTNMDFTIIPARISNYIHFKMWGEIAYPFPNFNGCTVEVWEWKSNFIPNFIRFVITYPCWD